MDHGDANGSLHVWGDYIRTSGTEHWSYATDFDGADLSASPRAVNVRLSQNSTTTFSGATLNILGAANATTTISNQGSGTYHVELTSGGINAEHYQFRHLDADGLYLNGNIAIAKLDHGDYELSVPGGSCVTVSGATVYNNATSTFTGLRFATSSAIAGYNVKLEGAPASYWSFVGHYGNLAGENFDSDPGDPRGYLIWEDSPDYNPRSQNWRWYHDETSLTPAVPAAGEEIAPLTIAPNSKLKLRLTVNELDGITGSNVKMRLQFSEFSDFSEGVFDVGEIGSTTAFWRYADGAGNDNTSLAGRVLSDSSASATHNESGLSASLYTHSANTAAEWEFTIHALGTATDTVYYFRPIARYDTLFPGFEKSVTYNAGESYPSLKVSSSTLHFQISGIGQSSSVEGVVTDVTTSASQIPFGPIDIETEMEAAHRFTVTTNAESGYQLFVMQRSNMIAPNGAVIGPIAATNDSPAAWPASPYPSGFGYHAGDDTLSGGFSSRFAANNTYARFQSTMEEIAYSPLPVEADTVDFVYKLEVSNMQEAGDYQTEIVYILVPTF
jgi:hypothetical protein